MPRVELVVARYDEPLDWLPRVVDAASALGDVGVVVYDKGRTAAAAAAAPGGVGKRVALPNVGREAHTFAWHAAAAATTPAAADVTVFLQGDPAPHVPAGDLAAHVADAARRALATGRAVAVEPSAPYECDAIGAPHHPALDLRGLCASLGVRSDAPFAFSPGAQYAVPRARLAARPPEFWAAVLAASTDRELGPWELERLWPRIFGS